ncbi:MAG: hypothetical protein RLZZ419_170 [Pseudomonadota bacterium]|jgi:2-polyprenyl-3-methyl-5-hydroxy-6-metoxy-1,4-benzoquinol methylase
MDKQTIDTYNREADSIAKFHTTLMPQRIYALIDHYFFKGGITLDVGCGIGRDTHWLTKQGFPVTGVDASKQMLQHAKSLYPAEHFFQDALPTLNQLGKAQFQNILCSAVLMHLNPLDLNTACHRLLQLLNDSGCLIISFRGTQEIGNREKGKLYETINITDFLKFFEENQCTVLVQESATEASRNLTWHNFVIKK